MIFFKSERAINDSQQNAENIPNVESDEMYQFKKKNRVISNQTAFQKGLDDGNKRLEKFFLQLVMLTGNR